MKKTSTLKKILVVLGALVAVVAIVAASVYGTVAYLTSSAAVSNVFTVGKVGITMTESKVNPDGTLFDDGATRVDANTYHLVPDTNYIKDPKIYVDQTSEPNLLFVTIRNDIKNVISTNSDSAGEYKSIEEQMEANGWKQFSTIATGTVYVYAKDAGTSYATVVDPETQGNTPISVFDSFHTRDDVTFSDQFTSYTIIVKAYAIQATGIDGDDGGSGVLTQAEVTKAWDAIVEAYPIHGTNP